MRFTGNFLLAVSLMGPLAPAGAQEDAGIPQVLQKTYGAFAGAMVQGEADKAASFYAEDAVALVDHEHIYRGRAAIREGFLAAYLQKSSREGEEGPGTSIEVDGAVVGEGVVTLAGRYSNPSGMAGIYSNTWQRRDNGDWRLAISVMTFEATDSTKQPAGDAFACTQVLGFSQSMEWFSGFSLAEHIGEGGVPEPPPLKRGSFLSGWQGRFFMGAAIGNWTDPAFPGWSGTHGRAYETPVHCSPEEVDRVVFNVSGPPRSPKEWAAAIESVAEVIRSKYPANPRVVMQPVVGAPEGMCRDIRAARTHPIIAEGIHMAAKRGTVKAGPEPKVASCSGFSDELGHLTEDGVRHVRQNLKAHYRDLAGEASD